MLRVEQLTMFGDRVLVDPDPKHVQSEGGLHIPETVLADNPNYYTMTGVVVRLGDGVMRHTFQCINCLQLAPQDDGPCPGCHQPLGNKNTLLFETSDQRYAFGVEVGQRVLFNRYAGKQVHALTVAYALHELPERPTRAQFLATKTHKFLIMRESEILGIVDGKHRILPGYQAPKWGKVADGLTI